MKHILLSALASVALIGQGVATPEAPAGSHHGPLHHDHMHPEKMHEAKSPADMAKDCEDHMAKIKDAGAALSPDMKAEFDYHLKGAALEIEALKDPNHKDAKTHAASCHRHLKAAGHFVKKHDHMMKQTEKKEAHQKRMAERKAKAEERKAKREAAKAARAAAHHSVKDHGKDGLDHGASEGADKGAPGTDAVMPAEKK